MSKNLKLKKVIKSFVLEPISCFSDSYMRMNILMNICTFYILISGYVSERLLVDKNIGLVNTE